MSHELKIKTRYEIPEDEREREGVGGGYTYYTAACSCGWQSDDEVDMRTVAVSAFGFHLDDLEEAQRGHCPVCSGAAELTPSGYLTCREHGSEHYRVLADA